MVFTQSIARCGKFVPQRNLDRTDLRLLAAAAAERPPDTAELAQSITACRNRHAGGACGSGDSGLIGSYHARRLLNRRALGLNVVAFVSTSASTSRTRPARPNSSEPSKAPVTRWVMFPRHRQRRLPVDGGGARSRLLQPADQASWTAGVNRCKPASRCRSSKPSATFPIPGDAPSATAARPW